MSSPSMSSLKSCPCRPPPLGKSTSKSNFTLLSVVCSSIECLCPQRHPTIFTQPRGGVKQAQFPDVVERARTYASKLVAGAEVSGSSPLVGSLFFAHLQGKHKGQREA